MGGQGVNDTWSPGMTKYVSQPNKGKDKIIVLVAKIGYFIQDKDYEDYNKKVVQLNNLIIKSVYRHSIGAVLKLSNFLEIDKTLYF